METTDPNNEEKQDNKRPDFLKDESKTENFGDTDEAIKEENYPSNSNQTQTGAATNNSELDIEPEDDGDDSLAWKNN